MKKKYPFILTDTEREELKDLIASGTAPARKLAHARISCSRRTRVPMERLWWTRRSPRRWRRASRPRGQDTQALRRGRPPSGPEPTTSNEEYHRKLLDGEQEACLVALACSEPPEGEA